MAPHLGYVSNFCCTKQAVVEPMKALAFEKPADSRRASVLFGHPDRTRLELRMVHTGCYWQAQNGQHKVKESSIYEARYEVQTGRFRQRNGEVGSQDSPAIQSPNRPLKQCVLLVAAGEQEDFRSFFAPQKSIAAFGSWAVPASQKTNLLGHSPHLGGPFSRVGPSGRLEGRFPPARLLLPGGRSGGSA